MHRYTILYSNKSLVHRAVSLGMEYVHFKCTNTSTKESFSTKYSKENCLGECIRNICVNLTIDPDTCEGNTRNVHVSYIFGDEILPLPIAVHCDSIWSLGISQVFNDLDHVELLVTPL